MLHSPFTFLKAFLILAIALILQFTVVVHGVVFDLAFAAIIAFASELDFWEFACLVLLSVFLLNSKPLISRPIALIAIYPFAVFFLHKILRWQGWFGVLFSILVGLILLSFSADAGFLSHGAGIFIADLAVCLAFGAGVFAAMKES